jgi:MOSC domain-containing protein YiiM
LPKLVGIAIRPLKHAPMQTLPQVMVTRVAGLDGDARGKPGKRQVTVMSVGQWQEACTAIDADLIWTTRRANLLVEGLAFDSSMVGKQLIINGMRLVITGETDPCHKMDAQFKGLKQALWPDWRGGVCCTVISDGRINLGDELSLLG